MNDPQVLDDLLELGCDLASFLGATLQPDERWPSAALLIYPEADGNIRTDVVTLESRNDEEHLGGLSVEVPGILIEKQALALVLMIGLGEGEDEEVLLTAVAPEYLDLRRAPVIRGTGHPDLGPWEKGEEEALPMPEELHGFLIDVIGALMFSSQSQT